MEFIAACGRYAYFHYLTALNVFVIYYLESNPYIQRIKRPIYQEVILQSGRLFMIFSLLRLMTPFFTIFLPVFWNFVKSCFQYTFRSNEPILYNRKTYLFEKHDPYAYMEGGCFLLHVITWHYQLVTYRVQAFTTDIYKSNEYVSLYISCSILEGRTLIKTT